MLLWLLCRHQFQLILNRGIRETAVLNVLPVLLSRTKAEVVLVISNKAPPPENAMAIMKSTIVATNGGPPPVVVALDDTSIDSSAYSGKICIFLGEAIQPILHNMDDLYFQAIKAVTTGCKGLIWITAGGAVGCESPDSSLSQGLLRTMRNKLLGRRYISLDLQGPLGSHEDWPLSSLEAIATITEVAVGIAVQPAPDLLPIDFEYAVRDGVLLVPRLYNDTVLNSMLTTRPALDWQDSSTVLTTEPLFQQERPLQLELGIPDLLDTLCFGDDDKGFELVTSPLAPDMVEIEPRAYGLNFRDVMVAVGQLRECVMGLECSGIITRLGTEAREQGLEVGDCVMALLLGLFASRAYVSWHGVAHMPEGMTFEDAASLPMVFSTAYVALVDVARLQKGQSVLIHTAAGGVGQAAVMLAKHLGAGDIYVTVGSQEKRDILVRQYGIPLAVVIRNLHPVSWQLPMAMGWTSC